MTTDPAGKPGIAPEENTDKTAGPLVSVIVLGWNGREMTAACIDSVLASDRHDFEIIVLDNGSEDDTHAWLTERYKGNERVKILRSETNRGFSGGNNFAAQHAIGKYLALLNYDAEVAPAWMGELVNAAQRDDTIGMVACKVLTYDDRSRIDNAGHLLYADGLNRGRGRLEIDTGQYDREEEVLLPSGCACLYRADVYRTLDGFDEDFFAYGDDTDLGLRARLAGYRCVYVPKAVAYHRYSVGFGAYSSTKAFLVERNRLFVAIKCLPAGMLLVSPVYTLARFAYQAYGALFAKGSAGQYTAQYSAWSLIGVLIKAYWSALRYLPRMVARRFRFRKNWKLSPRQVRELYVQHKIGVRELTLKD